MSLWPRARLAFVVLCFAVLVTMPARAQNPQSSSHAPVRYVVSLDNRPDHVVEVKIVLGPGASERDLQLPVWNALYQIRDFSQYVNWVRARTSDGQKHAMPDTVPFQPAFSPANSKRSLPTSSVQGRPARAPA